MPPAISSHPLSRLLLLILAFAITSLAAYGGWGLHGRPQPLPDVPDGKLRCVSYAPYRDGQSPFMEGLIIPPSQIEEDLAMLSKRFDCVRTYSVHQGLSEVPRIAAKFGMKVLVGVWISRDRQNKGLNEKEIAVAEKLANDPANKDTIMAIVVGNEVLLRREQTPDQMVHWITSVKQNVSVPVTYADVWEFWLKYPKVADAVDYVTIHILPYWEDEPISLNASFVHLSTILTKMRSAFPGKTLFIGETGWPSAGRTRQGAVPSRANQARYIREFVRTVGQEGVDYNVIESFDQPWKRIQEGTVGGHWGIFNVEREVKFPFIGPVSDDPAWRIDAATGMVIAGVLLLALAAGGYHFGIIGWFVAALTTQLCGAILVRQWQFIADTSYNLSTWLVSFSGMVLSAMAALLLLLAIADNVTGRKTGAIRPASIADTLAWLRRPHYGWFDRALTLGLLRTLMLFGGAAIAMQLLFDPRYRDFPTATYLIPAVGFLVLGWLQSDKPPVGAGAATPDFREERWLAVIMTGCTLVSVVREGLFVNYESMGWTGTLLLIAGPWLHLIWSERRSAQRVSLEEA